MKLNYIFIGFILTAIAACGGKPAPLDTEPGSTSQEPNLGLVSLTSTADIENKLWFSEESGSDYVVIRPGGRLWALSVSEASDSGACLGYTDYLGEFVYTGNGDFAFTPLPGRVAEQARLSIFEGSLQVRVIDGERRTYTAAPISFSDLPALCTFDVSTSQEGAVGVNDFQGLRGVWMSTIERPFGEDRLNWTVDAGVLSFVEYYGDSYARGEDCYGQPRISSSFFHLEGNRYLELEHNGKLFDVRVYNRSGDLFFVRDEGETFIAASDLPKSELARRCPNKTMPPPGSVAIESLDDIVGFWRLSYTFSDGRVDEVYASITSDGKISLLDPQNDSFTDGEQCSRISPEFATLQAGDEGGYLWSRDSDIRYFSRILNDEVDLYLQDQDLIIAGNDTFRRLRFSEFTLNDIPSPCTSTGNILVTDIDDIGKRLWRVQNTELDDQYLFIEPDGFVWQLKSSAEFACYDYDRYVGQIKLHAENLYRRTRVGDDLGLLEIGISQSNLVFYSLETERSTTYLQTDLTFEDRPVICDLDAATPNTDARAISDITELDGNSRSSPSTDFGEDFIYWTIENGEQAFFDFLGDEVARAEDCFVDRGPNGLYFRLEGNRYLLAFSSGAVRDHAIYLRDNQVLFYERDRSYFRELTEIEPSDPASACLGKSAPPDGAELVEDISELVGLWDISFETDDGRVDEMYVDILIDGRIDVYDVQNDSFSAGPMCTNVFDNFARLEPLPDSVFAWQRSDTLFDNILGDEILVFKTETLAILAGDSARRILKRTELSSEQLPNNCFIPITDLTRIQDRVWDDSITFVIDGVGEFTNELYFLVNPDGTVDNYDYLGDTFDQGEDCFLLTRGQGQFDKDTSSDVDNAYMYSFEGVVDDVLLAIVDNSFSVSYLNNPSLERFPSAGLSVAELAPICVR